MKKVIIRLIIISIAIGVCLGYVLIMQHKTNSDLGRKSEKNDIYVEQELKEKELAEIKQIENEKIEKELINISECSEDFMQEYFENIKRLNENNNDENILIAISKQKITELYGATDIIEAPNNQYILQYKNEEDKKKALEKLKLDSSIESVEENKFYTIDTAKYNSWGIPATSIDYAIESSNIDLLKDVTVAVVDSGVDVDLFNKYYSGKLVDGYNLVDSPNTSMSDIEGHGTHIAGTIAEGTPSNTKIMPIKVASGSSISINNVITAINYVTYYEKANVINMSFGNNDYENAVYQSIEAAREKNIICVCAAGNNNANENYYPASYNNTIGISSITNELKKSSFSNYGSMVTFTAPGTGIKSIMGKDTNISRKYGNADNDDDHETLSGTSMATPHAACAVAILKGYNKNLTLNNVTDILKDNAIDLGKEGWDQYYGYGLISFRNVLFRDREEPYEEYGVYKNYNQVVTNLEVTELNLTYYNYYSITNLMGSKIRIYKADGTSGEYYLWEVPHLEVLNYNPLSKNQQQVTIKYSNVTTTINVTNPNNFESGWEYDTTVDNKAIITGYKCHGQKIGKLYVPYMIDSKKVEAFDDNLRFADKGIDFLRYKYLYLPSDFKRIGNYSLANTSIEYLYGESNGIEIGAHAFESSQIQTIEVPLTKISESAFKNASYLNYVDVSCELEEIEDYAFYSCSNLKTIQLLYMTSRIGKYAFYNSGILQVKLGNIEKIEQSAFENCKGLIELYIDECSLGIESRAFWNTGMEYIQLGEISNIEEDAFAYSSVRSGNVDSERYYSVLGAGICDKTTKKLIVGFTYGNGQIPEEITKIGDYAFTGNNALQTIKLPSNISQIGQYSFKDCINLSRIEIYSDNINFKETSFDRTYEESGTTKDVVLFVHNNSEAKTYVASRNYKYRHFEPDELVVIDNNKYNKGDNVDYSKIIVKLIYHEEEDREEIVEPMDGNYGFYISYQNNNASEMGEDDTYYVVHAKNEFGYIITKNVEIELEKHVIEPASVKYRTHVQDYGWQRYVSNGKMAGTSGESKRLEGINIYLTDTKYSGNIEYRTHVQNIGWQNYVSNGAMAGTEGRSYRLEAIQIRLTGEISEYYDVYYRVHCQDIGWMNWAKNDEKAGTAGYSYRLEGIEIVLVQKGEDPPERTTLNYSNPYKSTLVNYKTHVQDYGWQDYVSDGTVAGTSGESKRLEGIKISLANPEYSGGITYKTHVQNIGWQGYVSNGKMAGTEGMSYRLEAIQIKLTGEIAKHYDVYYRVHCQNIGWMDWAKNDEKAGTAGYSYRLEAIQIKLIEKGKPAPGRIANHYQEK